MEELVLPDSIIELQKASIARNLSLKKVNIPKGLKHIPEYCFMGCPNLVELYVPDNIQTIGDKAFSLSGMKSVRLPNGVSIEASILDGCTNLKRLSIGNQIVMNLDQTQKFEGLSTDKNPKTGQNTWYVSYSDETGNIYTQEIDGLMLNSAKPPKQLDTYDWQSLKGVPLSDKSKTFNKISAASRLSEEPPNRQI